VTKFVYDHIHLRSPDPEATARFYERMFGAEIIRTPQGKTTRIDLKLGGVDIFIAPVAPDSGVNPPPTTPYQGLDHFGLRVSNIEAVVADLKAKGAEFTMELNEFRPGTHICFIRGPEGVSIEVLERKSAR
jgi:catechol 2,3-dioxygenase-like lactoylglutathione lyase family enzyme